VNVAVGDAVKVCVGVAVCVAVAVRVRVGVEVRVDVAVFVAVGGISVAVAVGGTDVGGTGAGVLVFARAELLTGVLATVVGDAHETNPKATEPRMSIAMIVFTIPPWA
jgi:hypothetical protein